MRWLMIAFLASIVALLLAVAGVARHIWLRRSRLRSNPDAGTVSSKPSGTAHHPGEEVDHEIEP